MTNKINNKKQVPSSFFIVLLAFLKEEYNFDEKSFLQKNNISYSDLFQKDFTLPLSLLKSLILEILNKEKSYSFLYKLAKLSSPSRLGLLGYIMLHSKDLAQALEKLCKYYLLIGKNLKPIFTLCPEGYKIVISFSNDKNELIDFDEYKVLIHLFAILHLINSITSFEIKAKFIHLKQKKSLFKIKDQKIEGIKSYFAQEEDAIYFDSSIKDIQTSLANESLLKLFEKQAKESLDLKSSKSELEERVSSLILVASSDLELSLENISSKLNLSPRVLQKRLKKEGTSFSKILLEVRKKLALYYLSKQMDLHSISLNLGYIDQSSFFRAFKKWYGLSPSQWKEKNT